MSETEKKMEQADSDAEDALARIRSSAVGLTLPEEELSMFQVGKEYEWHLPLNGRTIHFYVYYPKETMEKYPVFMNLHGGGFVKGHRAQDVVFCRNICQNAHCAVFDVDYHTAPEYRYPYALNEAYDAAVYLWEHADELSINREKMVIGGHSAGGNLTLGAALLAQERGGFQPAGLILDYPPVDLKKNPAEKRGAGAPGLRPPLEDCIRYNDWYIDEKYREEPTASPCYASDEQLRNLPSVLLIMAGHDVLGEEAEQLAAKMIYAGTTLVVKRVIGAHHGFVVRRKEGYEEAEKLIFPFLSQIFGRES